MAGRQPIEYDSPVVPMNRIYYNFILPHIGLNEKTASEVARIEICCNDKWAVY
jgi:hypothetical protein